MPTPMRYLENALHLRFCQTTHDTQHSNILISVPRCCQIVYVNELLPGLTTT